MGLITVKTKTIKSQQDIVAVMATYRLIDDLCDRLEREDSNQEIIIDIDLSAL